MPKNTKKDAEDLETVKKCLKKALELEDPQKVLALVGDAYLLLTMIVADQKGLPTA
jgi:hypothetical protein